MESKLKQLVLAKLEERKAEVQHIKGHIDEMIAEIKEDAKKAGAEIVSVKELLNVLIDEADEVTNTGIFDAVDAPILKSVIGKLLSKPAGIKLEAWFQALRSKII